MEAIVQTFPAVKSDSPGSGLSLVTNGLTAGNCLVVCTITRNGAVESTPTASNSTFNAGSGNKSQSASARVAYYLAIVGASGNDTVSVGINSNSPFAICGFEISGTTLVAPVKGNQAVGGSTNNTVTTGSLASTAAGNGIIALGESNGNVLANSTYSELLAGGPINSDTIFEIQGTMNSSGSAGAISWISNGGVSSSLFAAIAFELLKYGSNVPGVPTSLTANEISSSEIDLVWTRHTPTETGFDLVRATDSGFTQNVVTFHPAALATSYNDTTCAGGTTYYYQIRASNADGPSAYSTSANATTSAAGGGNVMNMPGFSEVFGGPF